MNRSLFRGLGTGGSAAIEFSVLAPAFLLMAFGVYEFGRWAWTIQALQETAATGARCVGIGQAACESSGAYSATSTVTYVQNVATGWGISIPAADITSTNSTSCGGVSGFSEVQISYLFNSVVPKLIPTGSGKTISVNACFPNSPGG